MNVTPPPSWSAGGTKWVWGTGGRAAGEWCQPSLKKWGRKDCSFSILSCWEWMFSICCTVWEDCSGLCQILPATGRNSARLWMSLSLSCNSSPSHAGGRWTAASCRYSQTRLTHCPDTSLTLHISILLISDKSHTVYTSSSFYWALIILCLQLCQDFALS